MPRAPSPYRRQPTCNLRAYYGVHVRGYIHAKILPPNPILGKQYMYESRQNLRLHEMHEPVVFRGYRGEWHPSYLPEFCNLSNAHLVKLFLRRRMYGTEKKEVHVQVSSHFVLASVMWRAGPIFRKYRDGPALEM